MGEECGLQILRGPLEEEGEQEGTLPEIKQVAAQLVARVLWCHLIKRNDTLYIEVIITIR